MNTVQRNGSEKSVLQAPNNWKFFPDNISTAFLNNYGSRGNHGRSQSAYFVLSAYSVFSVVSSLLFGSGRLAGLCISAQLYSDNYGAVSQDKYMGFARIALLA